MKMTLSAHNNSTCAACVRCSTTTTTRGWSAWPTSSSEASGWSCSATSSSNLGGRLTTCPIGGRSTSTCAVARPSWSTPTSTGSTPSSCTRPKCSPLAPLASFTRACNIAGWSRDRSSSRLVYLLIDFSYSFVKIVVEKLSGRCQYMQRGLGNLRNWFITQRRWIIARCIFSFYLYYRTWKILQLQCAFVNKQFHYSSIFVNVEM